MDLEWRTLDVPYRGGRFVIAGNVSESARTVILAARDAPGKDPVGYGEATPSMRVLGIDEPGIADRFRTATRAAFADRIDPDGPPPRNPLGTRAGPAACAVDGALLDLWARMRREPLWRALGLPRAKAATTATVSLGQPDRMVEEARGHAAAGFRCLKLKLGGPARLDLTRVQAVRDALPRIALRVDANEAWSIDDAVSLVPGLAECGVEFIEQPLPRAAPDEHLLALTHLCGEHDVAHVLDEAVHGPADATRVGSKRLAHGVNLKLQKAGGLRNGLALVQAAKQHDLKVLVGCFIETWAGISLALQLGGLVDWLDLDGAWLLADEPLAAEASLLEDGVLTAPDAPGLGVRPKAPLFSHP